MLEGAPELSEEHSGDDEATREKKRAYFGAANDSMALSNYDDRQEQMELRRFARMEQKFAKLKSLEQREVLRAQMGQIDRLSLKKEANKFGILNRLLIPKHVVAGVDQ